MSVRTATTAFLKGLALPVLERRWMLERARYGGTRILDAQAGNDRIADFLNAAQPMAAGKMGNVELHGLQRYIRNKDGRGLCNNWGRDAKLLFMNAGVYPATPESLSRFAATYAEAVSAMDLLAVWFQPGENRVRRQFAPKAEPMALTGLEPYYHDRPWSRRLAGKRVLVVSPFARTIERQYARRGQIWRDRPDVLPDFQLDTLRCPLSAGLVDPVFPDWSTALEALKEEMTRRVFDVALIGAGAWGLPLARHSRQLGRIGIHLGGPTQILFGIRGGRWDAHPIVKGFINESWVRPSVEDRPETFRDIEGGCYW